MTYELAKQIKEAGFPQAEVSHSGQHWIDAGGYSYDHPTGDGEEYLIPTLSELIEACDPFSSQAQFSLYGRAPDRWEATIIYFPIFGALLTPNSTSVGKTPEEAVAKLWLALHGNKETPTN